MIGGANPDGDAGLAREAMTCKRRARMSSMWAISIITSSRCHSHSQLGWGRTVAMPSLSSSRWWISNSNNADTIHSRAMTARWRSLPARSRRIHPYRLSIRLCSTNVVRVLIQWTKRDGLPRKPHPLGSGNLRALPFINSRFRPSRPNTE